MVGRAADTLALQAAADRGRVLGECANDARLLANEPANVLTPRVFAERAEALAAATELSVDILDEERIAELGMGLLLGVARGSAEPPRVIVLKHEPAGARRDITLAFVGKGITFDTGGISIKPADGMDRMKVDMGGGAAVIAAHAGDFTARCACARHRHRALDREHAGRPRRQAGRHPPERERQDRRGHEHGRGRPAGARRRAVVRAAARRHASRGCGDAHGRLRGGARPLGERALRPAG